jgi:hypothetical protein
MEITKEKLYELYINKKNSSNKIAKVFGCKEGKINYWLKKFDIKKRTISEAIYGWHNPDGDPFVLSKNHYSGNSFLFGLGLGLYWGEGNKKNKYAVRLGNSDPEIIYYFIKFLEEIYGIDKKKLRFAVQIFSDMDVKKNLIYWSKKIKMPISQFYKTTITPSRGIGTYREKSKYGVLTVHFSNKKLRDIICNEIEKLKER